MHILQTVCLSEKQVQAIQTLEAACRKHDSCSLTFPIEDGSLYFLLYDEEALLSVFSAFFNGIDTWECSAFTLPSKRRKGYFTQLLERFLEETEKKEGEEEFDIVFTADDSCADTRETLEAIGAALWYREYMMELRTADFNCDAITGDTANQITFSPSLCPQSAEPLYKINWNGSEAGSFRLDFQGRDVYFFGFEIAEPLRNRGIGTSALFLLLHQLSHLPAESQKPSGSPPDRCLHGDQRIIRLQVSGDNPAALALYRRAGFQITETVSCYLY